MTTRILKTMAIGWLLAATPGYALTYTFTTLAGEAGYGYLDGPLSEARFTVLQGITLDSAGNIYVSEGDESNGNETIRKISGDGKVSTIAGTPLREGHADGVGTNASFWWPASLVSDGQGTLYVADTRNELIRQITPDGKVSTIAGRFDTSGTVDGPGSGAVFDSPRGITRDAAGNLYSIDLTSSAVRKLSLNGTTWMVSTVAGGGPGRADGTGTAAKFYYPTAIVSDNAGNLYVSDTMNCAIRKVTPEGVVTTFAGNLGYPGGVDATGSAARFYSPGAIAMDNQGNLYVADNFIRIRKVTPAAVVTTLAGSNQGYANGVGTNAMFSQINGIAVDSSGNIYVTDQYNNAVRKITPAGVVTTLTGAGPVGGGYQDGASRTARFIGPYDLAFGPDGNLYATDGSHTIRKVTPAGVVTTFVGKGLTSGSADGTGSIARFNGPSGMAVDSTGNIFVADTGNSTIRKVTPSGVVTTVAGKAGSVGTADGSASVARFKNPQGVAVDAAGNLYVADTLNNTIRKISNGTVSTIAGSAGNTGTLDGTNTMTSFNNPYRIVVDAAGNLLVSDFYSCRVRKLTPIGSDWVVTTFAGKSFGSREGPADKSKPGCGTFEYLEGMAFDSQGNLYVADTWANTIRKVTNEGTNSWVWTLGGIAEFRGYLDGGISLFYQPTGVAVDKAGTLYVADTGNNVIRKGTLSVPAPARPALTSLVLTGKLVLSWPLTATGYVAEASQSLGASWLTLSNAVQTGTGWVSTNEIMGPAGFYRLRWQ